MELRTIKKIVDFDISKKATLCTQIDWRGSVPRKDYPMMLVDSNKNIIGTIGGGALEHWVIELTHQIIKTGKPVVKTFDLTNQDVEKSGSICGGSTTILLEPYTSEIQKYLNSIINDSAVINNIIITQVTVQENINVERKRINKDYHLDFRKQIVEGINEVIKHNESKSIKINENYYLIQNYKRQPILHIFGAGHVGQSVAEIAHFIELKTKIYDERSDLANKVRFPFALQINSNKTSELIKNTNIAPSDFVLVATRGHQHDFELMRWLLKLKIDYLSLMSSKKKWDLLSKALLKDGFSEAQINNVYSPVGLDIGSETVPEIAVSIIGEIVNHYRITNKSDISLSKS